MPRHICYSCGGKVSTDVGVYKLSKLLRIHYGNCTVCGKRNRHRVDASPVGKKSSSGDVSTEIETELILKVLDHIKQA